MKNKKWISLTAAVVLEMCIRDRGFLQKAEARKKVVAQCICIVGVADGDLLAVFEDLTLLRLIQAEQHAHQRTLAGAIFAQQGVYRCV